jgi:hypothetical protein
LSSPPILTGPKYSPPQLDFGAIDYSASAKRTFSLTPPVSGEITLEFPAGSFVAADLRRIPPLNLGQAPGRRALAPPMKPVPALKNGQTEVYKWSFAAGEEMQLDILFAPSFSKDKTPGLRTANMKFSGPGSISPWTVSVAMHGIVSGPLLQPNLVPGSPVQTKQPAAQAKSSDLDRTFAKSGGEFPPVERMAAIQLIAGLPGDARSSTARASDTDARSCPGLQRCRVCDRDKS